MLDASNNATETPPSENGSTDQIDSVMQKRQMMILIYAGILVVGTVCLVIRTFSFFEMCLRISINFHDMIFRGVSRAKMIFFNNNQSGQILNRFANDINNVDSMLPNAMFDVIDVSFKYFNISIVHFFYLNCCLFISCIQLVHHSIYRHYCNNYNHESVAIDTGPSDYFPFLFDAHRLYQLCTRSETN